MKSWGLGNIDLCNIYGSRSTTGASFPRIKQVMFVLITIFGVRTHVHFNDIVIPTYCTDVNCKYARQISDIDKYYDSVCDDLNVASIRHYYVIYLYFSTFYCF